jgi:hypothetical protein
VPLTQQEQNRLERITSASTDPNAEGGGGEGFSIQVLVYMFMKIVDLRDFALDQLDVNQQLRQRIKRLEEWAMQDGSEVYLHINITSEDSLE